VTFPGHALAGRFTGPERTHVAVRCTCDWKIVEFIEPRTVQGLGAALDRARERHRCELAAAHAGAHP
jgi:hypothetical protein